MSVQSPLVVTGASGWFGRTALYEYEKQYGPDALRNDVIACASSSRLVDIGSPYGPVKAVDFDALDRIESAGGLIHLAFLTREQVKSVGMDRYIERNRAITARVADFITRNPGIPIITTSSGAAAVFDQATVELTSNPYAALKQEEEKLWRRNGAERRALVFRVYAANGRFMKDPSLFALGDFLISALAGKQIVIQSERQVLRSYVHVGTLMKLFWAILAAPGGAGFRQVDAVLDSLSLVQLAEEISGLWALPVPIYRIDRTMPEDDYRADSGPFRELLQQYAIKAPDFREQLMETAYDVAKRYKYEA
jgi:nucleoside-diphosphate-sugar epimerase